MTIQIRRNPTDKIIELGGGARPMIRPNVDVRQCYDAQGNPTVDFTADFEKPLPIQSDEWDGVFQHFALEHISFPNVPAFLKEVLRILKPGGKFICVTANTVAQLEWLAKNPGGWDGKDYYTAASEIIFGSQTYLENAHKNFFNPEILTRLFQEAGFNNVTTTPYGARDTDICVQAVKPNVLGTNASPLSQIADIAKDNERISQLITPAQQALKQFENKIAAMPREQLFDKYYFDRGSKVGGYRDMYMDYPKNWAVFRHVMDHRPESVLEIGAGRGYILKRLQDSGIRVCGLDISRHCYLTRAVEDIFIHDICQTPWPVPDQSFDLCFSHDVLQHIPEEFLSAVFAEMRRTCKRGLHGIWFENTIDDYDKTICLKKPKDWWDRRLNINTMPTDWNNHIFAKEELEQGQIPLDVIKGDGKIKLNLGCAWTMFHHGWTNLDIMDINQFAQMNGYQFRQHDLKTGLPYQTGEVELIFLCHTLEHFTYREGLALLRECRRVLKPTGAMRIIVPDGELLCGLYSKERKDVVGNRDDYADNSSLAKFDEINEEAAHSPTAAGKLWSIVFAGHHALYDQETLCTALSESGFRTCPTHFRKVGSQHEGLEQIKKECTDIQAAISLFVDALPLTAS